MHPRHPQIQPTQALVIRAKVPVCDHWNFQLNNFWLESLDYRWGRMVCVGMTGGAAWCAWG